VRAGGFFENMSKSIAQLVVVGVDTAKCLLVAATHILSQNGIGCESNAMLMLRNNKHSSLIVSSNSTQLDCNNNNKVVNAYAVTACLSMLSMLLPTHPT